MAYIVMAYLVMAYTVMAYIGLYIVMAYVVMALYIGAPSAAGSGIRSLRRSGARARRQATYSYGLYSYVMA